VDERAASSAVWLALNEAERRAAQRLSLFPGVIPADAVVALSGVGQAERERFLVSGALVPSSGGFCLHPEVRTFAESLPLPPKQLYAAAVAHGRWLLEQLDTTRHPGNTSAALERMERALPDVRAAVARLSGLAASGPVLAAELWCAVSEAVYYRRLLPFDAPEFALAVAWAEGGGAELRVRALICAARAALEVRPRHEAGALFERAAEVARAAGLRDLEGDAVRGLGWVALAGGDVASAERLLAEARATHESTRCARGIADACMAQSVARVLSADRPEAERLLYRAEAIYRSLGDTARLAMLGDLRAALGMADERVPLSEVSVDELLSRGQYWRAALTLRTTGDPRAIERARVLADLGGLAWESLPSMGEAAPAATAEEPPAWTLRRTGARRVLVSPDGAEHDLTRRGSLLRMLEALGAAKAPTSATELFARAWPGETASHESALFRVYSTVRRLRAFGLPIATTGDGYSCDRVRVEV
jgi:hypothetical protein